METEHKKVFNREDKSDAIILAEDYKRTRKDKYSYKI